MVRKVWFSFAETFHCILWCLLMFCVVSGMSAVAHRPFLSQPDFMAMLTDVQSNPANMSKHLQDPRFQVVSKISLQPSITGWGRRLDVAHSSTSAGTRAHNGYASMCVIV